MPSRDKTRRSPPAPATTEAALPARWDVLLIAGFFAWTFVSLVFPLVDTDFWWHLKTGEVILEEGTVPQIDRYTFAHLEDPWIDMHWGFQVLIAVLYRVGGANLVILVKAAVITAAVGVGWIATGRLVPPWLKVLFWFPAVIAISGRGYERPEMLSQLFLAAWLFIAFRVEERPRLIWLLPAIQLIWANCHALFVLGLVVSGCYIADRLVREVAQGRFGLSPPPKGPTAQALIFAGGLVFMACFATPYFELGALFPLTLYRKFTVDQAFYSVNIGEFQQPIQYVAKFGFKNMYLIAEIALWTMTAASFVWLGIRQRRWSVLRLLLFAAYSNLAWEASRNINIFSLVSAVVLCANAGDVLARSALTLSARVRLRLTWGAGAVVAGLIILVISGLWNRWGEGLKPFGLGELKNWFIHDVAKFAGQPGFPDRALVVNIGQAAVYTYHNWPPRLIYMDARLEIGTDVGTIDSFRVLNEIRRLMVAGDPSWQRFVDPSGTNPPAVILDPHVTFRELVGMMYTPGWRLVYADATGGVFLDDATADKLHLEKADWTRFELLPNVEAALRRHEAEIKAAEAKAKVK